MSPKRLLLITFFAVSVVSCHHSDEEAPESEKSFHYTGVVHDQLTGSPIRNMSIYSCPGTHFGNISIQVTNKILKGTTDDCGNFSITIPSSEAHYTTHAEQGTTPIILFSAPDYGEFMQTPGNITDLDITMQRPLIDSIRWKFIDETALVIQVKLNAVPYILYPVGGQYQDVIQSSDNMSIAYEFSPGVYQSRYPNQISGGEWFSDTVEVAADESISIMVDASGQARSDGTKGFVIPASHPAEFTYILPLDYPHCN